MMDLKHIVSISLGSRARDHRVETELLGEKYVIERIGVDGNYDRFLSMARELDGRVDAIGMGGISLYLPVMNRTYVIKSAIPLRNAIKQTCVADGFMLRQTLEPHAVRTLIKEGVFDFKGKKAMVTCAVDRFSLAQALADSGCDIECADMIFALGIPFTVNSIAGLVRLAKILAPVVTKLPFDMLYPTGTREEKVQDPEKYARYYMNADIIAGDYNYIKRYMPYDLGGKMILTNTVTREDIDELKSRGVSILVTTTPEFDGRSFGTNVMEAVIAAALRKPPAEIKKEEYVEMAGRLGFKPRVVRFG